MGEAGWIHLTGFYRLRGRSQRAGPDRGVNDMNGVLLPTLKVYDITLANGSGLHPAWLNGWNQPFNFGPYSLDDIVSTTAIITASLCSSDRLPLGPGANGFAPGLFFH